MPLGKVRNRLLTHQAAVTNLFDRLEADGLVRRVPHTRDRRTTSAQITAEGRKIAIPATRQIAAQLQLGISDEQAEEVFAWSRSCVAAPTRLTNRPCGPGRPIHAPDRPAAFRARARARSRS